MVAGDLTLGIPGAGASDFATTPIPSITLNLWPDDDDAEPLRSESGYAEVEERSSEGTPQIIGPSYEPTYLWTVPVMLTLDEAIQLGALAKWQDAEYKAYRDGALRLIDEIDYLDAEPSPHSRTLLSALNPSWNAGYEYGFGVFKVKLQVPGNWRRIAGRWTDSDEEARRVIFQLVEA
ncbi:MAG: hypothetical protein AAF215_05130 [Cyanobacteria bacterium P01_A01_bin.123]